MALSNVIALCRRRWALPALASLARTDGDRFVSLSYRLGASQEALRHALDHLASLGLVGPNPGYGHPLRPEYVLTPRGMKIAPACERLDDSLGTLGIARAGLRRWALPAVYVIGDGAARFNDITRALAGITDRALSLTLTDLNEAAVVARRQQLYTLRAPGQALFEFVRRL